MIQIEPVPTRRQINKYARAGRLMSAKLTQTVQRGVDLISMYIKALRNSSKYTSGKHQFVSMNWIPVMLRIRRGGRCATGMSLSNAIIEAARKCAAAQRRMMSVHKAHDVPWRFMNLR